LGQVDSTPPDTNPPPKDEPPKDPPPDPPKREPDEKRENPPGWGLDNEDVIGEGVIVDDDGNLTLPRRANHYEYMWLPDFANGTVSKFHLDEGRELARYHSVSPISCEAGERPKQGEGCTGQSGAVVGTNYQPSRAAVDVEGNLWVANQGGGYPMLSLVTKIAATLEGCVDRDKDGKIRTNQVVENPDSTLSVTLERDDECVLFSTPMCTGWVAMLAISKGKEGSAGDVWVGCSEQTLYKLDSSNGRIQLGPIPLGMRVGAEAVVDSKQMLWLTNGYTYGSQTSTAFQGIDTTVPYEALTEDGVRFDWSKIVLSWNAAENKPVPIVKEPRCHAFGIAADSEGRVWFTGGGNANVFACFYDRHAPEGNRWGHCELPSSQYFNPRGIAFDIEGNIYMSGHQGMANSSTLLTRFRWNKDKEDTGKGKCEFHPIRGAEQVVLGNAQCPDTGGIGFDSEGNPWTTGYPVMRLNLETGQTAPVKRAPPTDAPRDLGRLHYFSLSDFTGYQIRNFIAPSGTYQQTLHGCADNSDKTSWKSISWEATVPPGARVQVYVQVSNANDKASWEKAERYGPFETSPVDLSQLGVPESGYLRVRFELLPSADRQNIPSVRSYEVKLSCAPSFV